MTNVGMRIPPAQWVVVGGWCSLQPKHLHHERTPKTLVVLVEAAEPNERDLDIDSGK